RRRLWSFRVLVRIATRQSRAPMRRQAPARRHNANAYGMPRYPTQCRPQEPTLGRARGVTSIDVFYPSEIGRLSGLVRLRRFAFGGRELHGFATTAGRGLVRVVEHERR